MKGDSKKPDGDLLTRQKIAALLAVRPAQFDRRYRPLIPAGLIVSAGTGKVSLFKPAAVRAILDGLLAEARQKVALADGDPLLLAGGNSPALERYRAARAGSAEISLLKEQQKIIFTDELQGAFTRFAALLQRGLSTIAKHHGDEAHRSFTSTVDAAFKAVDQYLTKGGNDGEA